MQVHLIDGTFELFRCFHGAPRARSSDGREVGAVRGLLFTLVALLRRPEVTHVAVAFDRMTARVSPGEAASDAALLRSQYMPAADAVRALGLTVWPMHRHQADDALATGAARCKRDPRVVRVVICTTDKDLMQCIEGERVVLLDRVRNLVVDEARVRERFGVPPRALPDLFALVGDPSDGLPGVPRWGMKAASLLLGVYGSLDGIPDDASEWHVKVRGAEALARSLRERRREARLMRDLSLLVEDLPIDADLETLAWRGPRTDALEALVARVGGEEILGRLSAIVAERA